MTAYNPISENLIATEPEKGGEAKGNCIVVRWGGKQPSAKEQSQTQFREAKEPMGLSRARRRGLEQVQEQCLMTAMAQNIKRIVKLSSPKDLFAVKFRLSGNKWSVFKALLIYFLRGGMRILSSLSIFIYQHFD